MKPLKPGLYNLAGIVPDVRVTVIHFCIAALTAPPEHPPANNWKLNPEILPLLRLSSAFLCSSELLQTLQLNQIRNVINILLSL